MPQRIMHISDLCGWGEPVAGSGCAVCANLPPHFRNRCLELQHWVGVGGAISGKLTRQQNMQILRDTEIRRWLASIVSCWSISLWIWPVLTFLIAHVEIHLRQPSTQLLQNAAMHPCSEIFCLKWIVKQSWQSKGNPRPPKLPPLNLLGGLRFPWNKQQQFECCLTLELEPPDAELNWKHREGSWDQRDRGCVVNCLYVNLQLQTTLDILKWCPSRFWVLQTLQAMVPKRPKAYDVSSGYGYILEGSNNLIAYPKRYQDDMYSPYSIQPSNDERPSMTFGICHFHRGFTGKESSNHRSLRKFSMRS